MAPNHKEPATSAGKHTRASQATATIRTTMRKSSSKLELLFSPGGEWRRSRVRMRTPGISYLLGLPSEIRLVIYEMLFGKNEYISLHQSRTFRVGTTTSRRTLPTSWRQLSSTQPKFNYVDALRVRLVHPLIAEETRPFLFRTIDFGWVLENYYRGIDSHRSLGGRRAMRKVSDLRTMLQGKWQGVREFDASADDLLRVCKLRKIEHVIPQNSYLESTFDATEIFAELDKLGWAFEDRNVIKLTIHRAIYLDNDLSPRTLSDLQLHLALLASYFESLREVHLVDDFQGHFKD